MVFFLHFKKKKSNQIRYLICYDFMLYTLNKKRILDHVILGANFVWRNENFQMYKQRIIRSEKFYRKGGDVKLPYQLKYSTALVLSI